MAVHLPINKQFHPPAVERPLEQRPSELQAAEVLKSRDGEKPRDGERGPALGANMRVGDLAKRTGKTVRALHLYEEHKLLSPAQRSNGGYRLYNRESELRVRWIDKLQQMGFSLTDIKQIVNDVDQSRSAPDAMTRVKGLFREKLEETREQLIRLTALEGELDASLSYLETCNTCETEELLSACNVCARHQCDHRTPDLVAGFRVH